MKLASVILEFIVSLHFYGCFYTFFRSYTNAPIRTNFITKQPMKALLFITSINLSYLYIYLAIGFFCASSFILILNTSTSVTSSLSPFFFLFLSLLLSFFFLSLSFFIRFQKFQLCFLSHFIKLTRTPFFFSFCLMAPSSSVWLLCCFSFSFPFRIS